MFVVDVGKFGRGVDLVVWLVLLILVFAFVCVRFCCRRLWLLLMLVVVVVLLLFVFVDDVGCGGGVDGVLCVCCC